MAQAGSGVVNDDLSARLADMTLIQLKHELRKRKLKTTGPKNELSLRLLSVMQVESEQGVVNSSRQSEDRNSGDEEEDDGDATVIEREEDEILNDNDNGARTAERGRDRDDDDSATGAARRRNVPREYQVLTFRDIEESMETFSGDDNLDVTKWIHDFEEMATMCEWSDIQKVVYARRLLRGSAKLFIGYNKNTKTWTKLRRALVDEFAEIVDSYAVHQELSRRKKSPDESFQAYIYKMLEIAAQADVDTRSVIQYIIEGVQDDAINKTILHGAKTIRQLKEKFIQYEAIKREAKLKQKPTRPEEKKRMTRADVGSTEVKRCFNCGSKDHLGKTCPTKNKGAKCFKCNQHGHIAKLCKVTTNVQKEAAYVISNDSPKKQSKQVEIANQHFVSVIDTGSDLSLMSRDCYEKIGCPKLEGRIRFDGVGALNNQTYGSFATNILIDNEVYEIVFHVVDNNIMRHAVLIGADFLNLVELHSVGGQVTVHKMTQELSNSSNLPEVLQVDVVENTDSFEFSHISDKNIRQEVENIARSYKPHKTREVDVKMTLVLKDDIPVYQKPRRLSQPEKEEVDRQLSKWLDDGVIRPSNSDYASPVVLVKKKTGDTRICVDFRKLNQNIIKDRYPLPLIEDQIDRLQGSKIFSVLDLKNGFFHVEIAEDSRKYTSFVVPSGQYEFIRMPFGLCNSPAVFQKFVNAVFKDLISKGVVLTYMDDLIIPSQDVRQAIKDLKSVLETSSQAGLCINWRKCRFLQTRIEYLGHVVENGIVRPSEYKTNAVMKFPIPRCIKDVQSFLGLTGYFRKFIYRYSIIARPLTNLLRNSIEFRFGKNEEQAFQDLKHALSNKPVLKLYRIGAETELHTDASKFGYGAILLQKDCSDNTFHPIYYASEKTTPAEEKYTSYELEVLAIVKALNKFRVYLLGISFKIVTDCKAFTLTMNKKDLCVRIARWALLLEEYKYEIQHRSGKSMSHVDALSRNPLPETLLITESDDSLIARFTKAQSDDQDLQKIIKSAALNKADHYILRNRLLYRDEGGELLLVVPKSLQASIARQAHEQGHFGVTKTEAIVRKDY